jgi:NADPH-dependent ferric siderophore reductase
MPESGEDPAMFPSVPLTTAAAQLRKSVLGIPRTEEPTMTDLTPGLDPAEVERLHSLLLAGSKEAAPAIRKVIERFPNCPTVRNYLHIA